MNNLRKGKKVWQNEILFSAAVTDMLGGSDTNDLCNYANGKRNVLFPRNVCYHCNPVWGLMLCNTFVFVSE